MSIKNVFKTFGILKARSTKACIQGTVSQVLFLKHLILLICFTALSKENYRYVRLDKYYMAWKCIIFKTFGTKCLFFLIISLQRYLFLLFTINTHTHIYEYIYICIFYIFPKISANK